MKKIIALVCVLALLPFALGNPLILLSGSPRPGTSAPAVVTANVVSGESSSSNNSFTQAVDCTGANYLMIDFWAIASTNFSSVALTYNGVSMTQLFQTDFSTGGFVYWARYRLVSPASGSNNLVVTFSGSNYAHAVWGCTPVSGVNTGTPEGTTANDAGSSSSPSITASSATGELVLATVLATGATVSGNGASQTTIYTQTLTAIGDQLRQTSKAGETSTVSSWTLSGSVNWGAIATPLKPL